MREGRCGRWIGVVVRRNVNGLNRSDGTGLSRSDAFLQFTDFRVQVGLVSHGRRHTAEKRGYFRASLYEAEYVVDEQKNVQVFFITEIFGHGQARKTYAQARSGRLCHLPVNERCAGLVGISRHNDSRLLKFLIQIVSFASALSHAGEYRNATMLHGNIVDQFLDQYCLPYTRATKQSDFSALQERLDQIDYLDARFKHLQRG